jgi:site-specific DNA-methyltransferase (adenine-specific)
MTPAPTPAACSPTPLREALAGTPCFPLLDLRIADCLAVMRETPDKAYDLAIVDPPYGIDEAGGKMHAHRSLAGAGKLKNRILNTGNTKWDVAPGPEYFSELRRVSKHQIIWGGNYFPLPPTRGIIWWDKCQPWDNFSHGELAWTSFDKPAKKFVFDNRTGGKIHPTQKPIALYNWLLANYAKPGDRILDTHMGSGSIAIACHYRGHQLTACEIDSDYYAAAVERIQRETRQLTFFTENS